MFTGRFAPAMHDNLCRIVTFFVVIFRSDSYIIHAYFLNVKYDIH